MALTKSDKTWVKNAFEEALGVQENKFEKNTNKLEHKFENKIDDVEQRFEAKIDQFKDEFYTKIDPILKEVVASREERVIIEHRLEKIEKKLNLQPVV